MLQMKGVWCAFVACRGQLAKRKWPTSCLVSLIGLLVLYVVQCTALLGLVCCNILVQVFWFISHKFVCNFFFSFDIGHEIAILGESSMKTRHSMQTVIAHCCVVFCTNDWRYKDEH